MREALRLHIGTHLRFFARSRLLLGLGVVLAGVWALSLIAFILLESSSDRFDMLKNVAGQLRWFAWFYTAAMGLFAFWWHTTQKTTSLVFTRPGRPEIWLLSVFGSAFLAAAVIHTAGFVMTLGLSVAWGIPFQAGFLWLALDGMLESLIIVSVLTGLSAAIHPALAVLVLVFFSESTFYWFDTMLLGHLQAKGDAAAVWAGAVEKVVRGIHAVVPILDPFAHRTTAMEESLRVARADWAYLAATAGYALCVFAF
jgi:hypothetical protein